MLPFSHDEHGPPTDIFESGGDASDVESRKQALTRIVRCTRDRCVKDHEDMLLEWGNIQATMERHVVGSAHPFTGALPDQHFGIVLTNAAGRMAGLVFSVLKYVEKFEDSYHMYSFTVYPYYHNADRRPGILFNLSVVYDPESLFASAAKDSAYSIKLSLKYVKELLVISFLQNNASVPLKGVDDYSHYEGQTATGARIAYYPRPGWIYWPKYGEAKINGVVHALNTVGDVADFAALVGTASPPAALGVLALLERLVDAARL